MSTATNSTEFDDYFVCVDSKLFHVQVVSRDSEIWQFAKTFPLVSGAVLYGYLRCRTICGSVFVSDGEIMLVTFIWLDERHKQQIANFSIRSQEYLQFLDVYCDSNPAANPVNWLREGF